MADTEEGLTRLGVALRELRLASGLSGERLADRLGVSQSKVSRVETARQLPSIQEVTAWLDAVSAPKESRAELLALAETLVTEVAAWRVRHRLGLRRNQEEIAALEQQASAIQVFQPVMIPGLLQTAEYARRVMSQGNPSGKPDLAQAVAMRLERQTVLYNPEKRFEFLLTEHAVRWRPGPPALLLAQLDRLTAVATLPNVTLAVIPLRIEAQDAYLHPFVIWELANTESQSLVTVETYTVELRVQEPTDIAFYRQVLDRVRGTALTGTDCVAFLRATMEDLARSETDAG